MWFQRRIRRVALVALSTGLLMAGCDGDGREPTAITLDELAGTWVASSNTSGTSLRVTPNNNPLATVDVINALGGTVTFTITTNDRFTLVVEIPALQVMETINGSFTLTGRNTAELVDDQDPTEKLTLTLSLSGNRLTVSAQDVELFDLNSDGNVDASDAARLEGMFARA